VHPRDGVRWLHSAGRVIAGDDGRPERIRGLTWDVTECPMRHVVG
jgi:PAS domain-containing protein